MSTRSPYIAVNGDEIRRRRQNLGLTIGDFADRVGLSAAYMGQVERGYRRRIGPRILRSLADALGVEPEVIRADVVEAA